MLMNTFDALILWRADIEMSILLYAHVYAYFLLERAPMQLLRRAASGTPIRVAEDGHHRRHALFIWWWRAISARQPANNRMREASRASLSSPTPFLGLSMPPRQPHGNYSPFPCKTPPRPPHISDGHFILNNRRLHNHHLMPFDRRPHGLIFS